MNELSIDGKKYISSKHAAEITGYAKDYVGQLCREGHVTAKMVGRSWYVLETAIREHRFGSEDAKEPTAASKRSVAASWEAPTYHPEVSQYLPEIDEKAGAAGNRGGSDAASMSLEKPNAGTIAAIQDAWQEWFSTANAAAKTPELEPDHLLADHEEVHTQADASIENTMPSPSPEIASEDSVDAEAVSYTATEASPEEMGFADSEAVSIPISRIAPAVQRAVYVDIAPMPAAAGRATRENTVHAHAGIEQEEEPEQETKAGRGSSTRSRAPRSSAATWVIRGLLILVAVIAIGIGVIGTGVANEFLTKVGVASYLNAVSGNSSYEK